MVDRAASRDRAIGRADRADPGHPAGDGHRHHTAGFPRRRRDRTSGPPAQLVPATASVDAAVAWAACCAAPPERSIDAARAAAAAAWVTPSAPTLPAEQHEEQHEREAQRDHHHERSDVGRPAIVVDDRCPHGAPVSLGRRHRAGRHGDRQPRQQAGRSGRDRHGRDVGTAGHRHLDVANNRPMPVARRATASASPALDPYQRHRRPRPGRPLRRPPGGRSASTPPAPP